MRAPRRVIAGNVDWYWLRVPELLLNFQLFKLSVFQRNDVFYKLFLSILKALTISGYVSRPAKQFLAKHKPRMSRVLEFKFMCFKRTQVGFYPLVCFIQFLQRFL